MASKVEICGVNTSSLPRYKDKEMHDMLTAIKAGDMEVRDEFIRGNLRLVLSVIQKFSGRGVKFSTYAVPMIIGEVRRYLRDNNSIRVSRSMRDMAYKALTAKEALGGELQREPTIEEIAGNLGVRKEDVVLALDSIQDPVSLFEPLYNDEGDPVYVMDQIKDIKNTDARWVENLSLSEAMKKLSLREQHILTMRFFEGKTQMEVADEISISQAQVSRLEKNALNYMKKYV